ncbi:MAG: TonB-dependent receptor, partial [Verrucomicrobiota bacterium]
MSVPMRNRSRSTLRVAWRARLLPALLAASIVWCGAAEAARRAFDVPAEEAEKALRRFSVQSGFDVVFATGLVAGVRTQAVKGDMTPREALEAMLAQTRLIATQDTATGAFMINRANGPNAPRAAPAPSSSARPAGEKTSDTSTTMTTSKRTPALARALGAVAALFGADIATAQPAAGAATGAPTAGAPHSFGTVSGAVSNAATGEFLRGAILTVDGAVVPTTTDRSGEFVLVVPAGRHVVGAAFTGLQPMQRTVEVTAGASARQDFPLTSDVYQLEKYVVSGLREGQAAALQNERQAMNMKSVAAIDAFGNPGAAVGELIQRLPGIAVDIGSGGEPSGIYIRGMNHTFSSMMVDGNQLPVTDGQTVSGVYTYLGQVSTNNLESLEVIKAPLPDMDGNAISGYINLRTKRAFDRSPGRILTVSVGTKWADLDQHDSVPGKDRAKLDLISLGYSDVLSVFGGRNNLGISASINFNAGTTYVHEAGPSLATANANQTYFVAPAAGGAPLQPLVRGWSSGNWYNSDNNSYAKTYGLNIDYKLNEDTVLYFKANLSDTRTDDDATPSYFRWRVYANQAAASFAPGSTYDVVRSTATAATVDLESTLYIRESLALGLTAGFEKKLFARTATLTFDANYNYNRTRYPAINEVKARITGVGFEVDRRGRDEWFPAVTQIGGPDWTDPRNYQIVPSQTTGSRIIDFNVPATRQSLRADFQKELATVVPAYFKVGAKHASNRVTSDRRYRYYNWVGPTANGIEPYVGYNFRTGSGNYGPFPFLQVPTTGLPNDLWANPANFTQTPVQVWQTELDTIGSFADVKEQVSAGYVQGQVKLNKLRILTGLRMEVTQASGASPTRRIVTTGPETNTSSATLSAAENAARARANWPDVRRQSNRYDNIFPGAHFVYSLSPSLQARASYSVSITRPNPSELTPRHNVTESTQIVTKGNAELKPYTSDNFEAALQYYFEPVGTLSAGVFLKEITNYFRSFDGVIGTGADNGFDGQYAGYILRQNRNIGGARIRGFELSYAQQYTFLPGVLKGLGSFANFTYLETQGDFGTVTTTKRLPNFTPRSINAGITWRARGFDLRVLGNYRSDTYIQTLTAGTATTSGTGTGGIIGEQIFDTYQRGRLLLDFKGAYTINRTYSIYFDIYNLANEWSFERVTYAFGRELPFTAQG